MDPTNCSHPITNNVHALALATNQHMHSHYLQNNTQTHQYSIVTALFTFGRATVHLARLLRT